MRENFDPFQIDVRVQPATRGVVTDTLTAIVDEIVGTRLVRVGPRPDTTMILQVVADCYVNDRPIPIVVPWGSEKPDGSTIDLAELIGLKRIECLNERIQRIYPPGIFASIRVEDASAGHLFYKRAAAADAEAQAYSDDFDLLAGRFNMIRLDRETNHLTVKAFCAEADTILDSMHDRIVNNNYKAVDMLRALGWGGPDPLELIDSYLVTYSKLYPDNSEQENKHVVARYFAGSLARKRLGLTGADASWGSNYLELSFFGRGTGSGRRFYYRTVVAPHSHVAPWRARGYLTCDMEPRVTSFHDQPNLRCIQVGKSAIRCHLMVA